MQLLRALITFYVMCIVGVFLIMSSWCYHAQGSKVNMILCAMNAVIFNLSQWWRYNSEGR